MRESGGQWRKGSPVELTDLLRQVADVLDRLGVPYAVVGSVASSLYGDPRLTNDVDIVADLQLSNIEHFLKEFPPEDFYVSDIAVRQAIQNRGQFNVIHSESGYKADIVIPGAPYDETQLERRTRVRANDPEVDAFFATPEDIILKKMEYFREGGSEKHLRDIAGILKIRGTQIDRTYIEHWAQQLGVTDIWAQINNRLGQ